MLKNIHQIVPSNRIKCFFDVKLEEECGSSVLVEFPSQIPHIKEVIVNAPPLDESALDIEDGLVHMRGKSRGHHLGN